MAHDQLQDNFLMLGSWYGTHSVLVRVTDFNAAGEAKWDKLYQEANSKDISGAYNLLTVNGMKLPATVSHEGRTLQVRSGAFKISADGKCSGKITFVLPNSGETTSETRATYSREGPTLNMQLMGEGGRSVVGVGSPRG